MGGTHQSSDAGNSPEQLPEFASYDMLDYLDEKIACQENNKDVRCWSSVNKLQMFVAGATIEHDAVGVRIEKYHELIDDVWKASANDVTDSISVDRLQAELAKRFPHDVDESSGKFTFRFSEEDSPVLVMDDLVKDYSDTIETWRLLQSWASNKTAQNGDLQIDPVFSEAAIEAFHDFLSSYDIALLKRAKQIANNRKLTVIDGLSMAMAFDFDPGSSVN